MNKTTAQQKGYETTGSYDRSRSPEIEAKLLAIKQAGYKAIIATIPPDPYARGFSGTGYIVMAEPKYRLDNTAKSLRESVNAHASLLENMRKQMEEELARKIAEVNSRNEQNVKWLADNGY